MSDYGIGFYDENENLVSNFDFGELTVGRETEEKIFYLYYKKGMVIEGDKINNILLKVVNQDGKEEGPFVENGLVLIKVLNPDNEPVTEYDSFTPLSKGNYFIIPEMEAGKRYTVILKLRLPVVYAENQKTEVFRLLAIPSKSAFQLPFTEAITKRDGLIFAVGDSIYKNFTPVFGKPFHFRTGTIFDFSFANDIHDIGKVVTFYVGDFDFVNGFLKISVNSDSILVRKFGVYHGVKIPQWGNIVIDGDIPSSLTMEFYDKNDEMVSFLVSAVGVDVPICHISPSDYDGSNYDRNNPYRLLLKTNNTYSSYYIRKMSFIDYQYLTVRSAKILYGDTDIIISGKTFNLFDYLDITQTEQTFYTLLICINKETRQYEILTRVNYDPTPIPEEYVIIGKIEAEFWQDEQKILSITEMTNKGGGNFYLSEIEKNSVYLGNFIIKNNFDILVNPVSSKIGEFSVDGTYFVYLSDLGGVFIDTRDIQEEGIKKIGEIIVENKEIRKVVDYLRPSPDYLKKYEKMILGAGTLGISKLTSNHIFHIGDTLGDTNKYITYRR